MPQTTHATGTLTRIDDLLWVPTGEVAAHQHGMASVGGQMVRHDARPAVGVRASEALVLRTDHVELRTNLSWFEAREVAVEAQGHVERVMATYGDRLDLRLPGGPLKVVCTATREEFQTLLAELIPIDVSWGAFYDGRDGVVYMSRAPAARGALPWQADLRHEMTHQILDLTRPNAARGRPFGEGWFWLWEGIPLANETLGDPPGVDRGTARLQRFAARRARGEVTPWRTLFRMGARDYEGRHYDQTASMMRFLLDPRVPARRQALLDFTRALLRGSLAPEQFERRLGRIEALERAWLAGL